jgi:predicted enzyme related to lactoylglutathione lyase
MIYIMVASAARTVDAVVAAGGAIVQHVNPDEGVVVARFRDPAGNVLGIYEQEGLAEAEAEGEQPAS